MYPLPPLNSGAYLGIDRKTLKKRGVDWADYQINLTMTQLYVMDKWSRVGEVSATEMWAAFGTGTLTPILQDWFRTCLCIKKQYEQGRQEERARIARLEAKN